MENTQIETIKTSVTKGFEVVKNLIVVTAEEYNKAIEVGTRLKQISKEVTARKEEITKPMNEALKSARALFKPLEETLEKAESELKGKMLIYMQEERKREAEAQKIKDEEIAKQKELLKKGEITQTEASKNTIQAMITADEAKVEKTTKTESGAKATEKFITEYVVVDKTKIPLEFLEVDMVKVKASFKAGNPVVGVEERKKSIISF